MKSFSIICVVLTFFVAVGSAGASADSDTSKSGSEQLKVFKSIEAGKKKPSSSDLPVSVDHELTAVSEKIGLFSDTNGYIRTVTVEEVSDTYCFIRLRDGTACNVHKSRGHCRVTFTQDKGLLCNGS